MIDEVHTLIGAGAAEGAIDAANILKPALARGELQCIGATTLDEYRKHIEKDPALERYGLTLTASLNGASLGVFSQSRFWNPVLMKHTRFSWGSENDMNRITN